jgi:hypothetical protein
MLSDGEAGVLPAAGGVKSQYNIFFRNTSVPLTIYHPQLVTKHPQLFIFSPKQTQA